MGRKDRFQRAIIEALELLKKEGKKITKTSVIECARFEDGTTVGKTTLYGRHTTTREFVHADLLRMIDDEAENQQKIKGQETRSATLKSLRKTIAELKQENEKLIDQVVEQESKLQSVSGDRNGDKNVIASQEDELYVLASVTNQLTENSVRDLVEQARRYSLKYRNDPRLRRANEEVERYIDEIHRSKFLRLSTT